MCFQSPGTKQGSSWRGSSHTVCTVRVTSVPKRNVNLSVDNSLPSPLYGLFHILLWFNFSLNWGYEKMFSAFRKKTVYHTLIFWITNTYLRCALIPLIVLWLVLRQALILAFYYSKNKARPISQTTLERSLMCIINIHACEPIPNGAAKSLHSCTEGTGSTESLFWRRKRQSNPRRFLRTGTGYTEWTIRTDICVFHNSW